MQITCPTCDKSLKVADNLAGKKVRCPGCKTPVLVTSPPSDDDAAFSDEPSSNKKRKAPPKRTDDDAMRCPKCAAAAVEPLPPNQFSRNPGYVCTECDAHMRPPGTTGFYVFAMLLGGFILLVGIGLLVVVLMNDVLYVRALSASGLAMLMGAAVAVWALKQMRLPIPLNAPPAPSRLWLWIGLLVFVFLILPGLVGCLFVGLMYYIQEMM